MSSGTGKNLKGIRRGIVPSLIIMGLFVVGLFVALRFGTREEALFDSVAEPLEDWEYVGYEDGRIIYRTVLPSDIKDDYQMCYASAYDFDVYIDNQLRRSFSVSDLKIPSEFVKVAFFKIPLTSEDCCKEIVISRVAEPDAPLSRRTIYIGDGLGLKTHYTAATGTTFYAAIVLMILAVMGCFIGLVLYAYSHEKQSITAMSLGILMASLWYIFDSDMFQFVFGYIYIDGILSYMLSLLLAYPFLSALNQLQDDRYKVIISILKAFLLSCYVVFTVLNFTTEYSYADNLFYITIVNGMVILCAFILIIVDIAKKEARKYALICNGFIVFLMLAVVELVVIQANPNGSTGGFIVSGLYVLLVTTTHHTVRAFRTNQRQREEALQQSKAKSEFLASMSHEIRTPINAIVGMNEMILRENKDPNIAEYARTIDSSSNYLLSVINDILDISKIEAGKADVVVNSFDLADFVSDMVVLFKERCDSKELLPLINVNSQLPSEIVADEMHIKQIVINLISNAVKYTDSGEVSLYIYRQNDTDEGFDLCIKVKDTGIGIREEDQEKLFENFTRVDLKHNNSIQGTGLGLAIIKGLLDLMNGSVELESEYGKGSTFTVKIPVKISDPTPINLAKNRDKYKDDEEEFTGLFKAPDVSILVVDDMKQNLMVVKHLLKNTGMNIDVATDAMEAKQMCRDNVYHLILMDHMMPKIDGIEALHMIRADEQSRNRDTVMIAFTANAIAGMRDMYIQEGFADYIAKPVKSKALAEKILEYLDDSLVMRR